MRSTISRCGALLAAVLMSLLATPAAAPAADPGATTGVYRGAAAPGAVAEYEAWLGRPMSHVVDFLDMSSWSTIENPSWWLDGWNASAYGDRVAWSIPMLPASGASLASGAAGSYNEHFRRLAERLVAGGHGDAILRLGWEFNGNWFPWTIATANGPSDYAAFWRQIVTTMRSVTGANFRFEWCPVRGGSWYEGRLLDAAAAWPGDAYVDYVGLDHYDQSWAPGYTDPATRWANYLSEAYGLQWHRDFAAARGKPMTFPEWGLVERPDGHGGGDAPLFVERMHDWISQNDVAYHAYFEYDIGDTYYRLSTGRFPQAADTFRTLFGPATTAEPAPGDGTTTDPAPGDDTTSEPAPTEPAPGDGTTTEPAPGDGTTTEPAPDDGTTTEPAPPGRTKTKPVRGKKVRMSRVRVGRRSIRLSGRIARTRNGRTVTWSRTSRAARRSVRASRITVRVRKRTRGGWRTVRRARARVSSRGRFVVTLRRLPAGSYRATAKVRGARATSRGFRVRR